MVAKPKIQILTISYQDCFSFCFSFFCSSYREYRLLLQDIEYPSFFPAKATSLIKGLLEVDEDKRLGVGSIKSLKKHGFFLAIEWDKLAQKHIVPPFIPQSRALPTKTSFDDFESFINNEQNPKKEMERKIDWMAGIEELDQLLFKEWDFISPHTLKIELGIAGEMEVSERNERASFEEDSSDESRETMNPAKGLQTETSTTKLTLFHSILLTRSFCSCFIKNAHNLASLGADTRHKLQGAEFGGGGRISDVQDFVSFVSCEKDRKGD